MRLRSNRFAAATLTLTMACVVLVGCADENGAAATAAETTLAAVPSESTDTTVAADTTVVAEVGAAGGAGSASTVIAPNNNIFYTAVAAGSFLTLASLLANADLIKTIKSDGPFTVFAPTDAAFAEVPKETLDALLADKEKLKKMLLYHVVPGTVMSDQFKAGDLATAEGSALTLIALADSFTVNDVVIAAPDITASNGVIHVINTVLIPPDL